MEEFRKHRMLTRLCLTTRKNIPYHRHVLVPYRITVTTEAFDMFEKIQAYLANAARYLSADEITPRHHVREPRRRFAGYRRDGHGIPARAARRRPGAGGEARDRRRAGRFCREQARLSRLQNREIRYGSQAALLGEIAVPCYPQSATAGRNSRPRVRAVSSDPDKRR